MGVYRLYSGDDGESRITQYTDEELANIKIKGTMSFSVQKREPGHFMDQHPAASRRWHIHVEGRMIIIILIIKMKCHPFRFIIVRFSHQTLQIVKLEMKLRKLVKTMIICRYIVTQLTQVEHLLL